MPFEASPPTVTFRKEPELILTVGRAGKEGQAGALAEAETLTRGEGNSRLAAGLPGSALESGAQRAVDALRCVTHQAVRPAVGIALGDEGVGGAARRGGGDAAAEQQQAEGKG